MRAISFLDLFGRRPGYGPVVRDREEAVAALSVANTVWFAA
jgi:hypothetical protein